MIDDTLSLGVMERDGTIGFIGAFRIGEFGDLFYGIFGKSLGVVYLFLTFLVEIS